jgi:hypothetical protein
MNPHDRQVPRKPRPIRRGASLLGGEPYSMNFSENTVFFDKKYRVHPVYS